MNRNMLTLHRDYTLSTLFGHTITFKKDEPTHVPMAAYAAAIAVGAVPADGGSADVILEDAKNPAAPGDPLERNRLLLAAIEELVEKNDRKDFTAAGLPSVKAVERVLGFDVDGREVAANWQELHEKKAAK